MARASGGAGRDGRRRVVALALLGMLPAALRAQQAVPGSRFAKRFEQILQPSRTDPAPAVVLLGDSITQQLEQRGLLQQVCGLRVLNAGVSGAGIFDIDELLPALVALKPRVVVLALGVNDARWRVPHAEHLRRWSAGYLDVVQRLAAGGARILLSLPLPFEPGKLNSTFLDAALAAKIRGEIVDISRLPGVAPSVSVLDAGALFAAGHGDLTGDGIHLNERGLQLWAGELEPAIRQALGAACRA